MRRRRILAGAALVVGTAGCHEETEEPPPPDCGSGWEPAVEADEPTLAPGEATTVHVSVRHVSGLGLRLPSGPPDYENVVVGAGDAELSPRPDRTADSYPPGWYWEECTHVDVEVPVRALSDAEPGAYDYGVQVVQSLDGQGDSVTREFTVTVAGDGTPDEGR